MLKAKDLGKYYKITTDNRSLNYALYKKVGNYKSIKLIDLILTIQKDLIQMI